MSAWRRTWWAVFVANLVTAVGMMSFLPFFPGILERMGVAGVEERMVWSGVLFGAAPLAAAVMGPVWGSIGDRHGRKLMVIRALLAIAVFVGAMSLATSPWTLLALRLGQGVFSGFVPPSITLVSIGAPREIQGRVTGTLQAALPAGMIIGPLAGDLVLGTFGPGALFGSVAASAGFSAALVALLASEDASLRLTQERFSPTSLLAHTVGDLRILLARRRIRWALGTLFAVQLALGATNPQLELYVRELAQGNLTPGRLTAWLFSAFAIASLVASPLWGRIGDRFGHFRTLCAASALSALLLSVHAAAAGYAALLVARVLMGLVAPGTNIAAFGLTATETAEASRGAAFGAVFSARTLAVSIGSMGGGALAALFGIRGLFLSAAAFIAVFLALMVPRYRATTRTP